MRAIGSRIIVQVEKENTCTQKIGNFEIPSGAEEFWTATVISVGEEIKPEALKPGEKVYIYLNAGKSFFYEGKEYRVISVNEIITVL